MVLKTVLLMVTTVQMDGSPLAVTSVEVPMDESLLVATAAEVQTKALVATTTTEVLIEESSLVATATAEVQMRCK